MRKIAAILLLCIYSFSLFGYHAVFHVMESDAERDLQASLDNNAFCEADLITLTVPLNLPYLSDKPEFERVDGEITKDGRIYHFVKRAIRNSILVLLCLPDEQKMKLEVVKSDFAKQASDVQDSSSSKKNSTSKDDLAKSFRVKYLAAVVERRNTQAHIKTQLQSSDCDISLKKQPRHLPEQPPELS